ncbi:unnamed protein product [Moneuplotes crassus]|uniref:DNA repair nuclease/redox regulator APEX1 n=3 Tax=Euplotes crassus TaxID=5936 RepID=A0AAD1XHM7_EUPCR|nr:unnamed protein product [Moneuplotes crassus]|eukprot:CAMPEP_0197013804 /NCGR_PEP_ID=MMETSP1380-20130617/67712_1 /TAXON_ID=5936 /ORGANISM="Euplotes crassus, Strain CT5" /LENGTH=333 /DNA_ID=CAMNT_0042438301 /DNA_START=1 /DNA_END=1002 /DNA_ORIENTATION=+
MSKSSLKRSAKQMGFDTTKRTKKVKSTGDTQKQVQSLLAPHEEEKYPESFETDTIKIYSWNVNGIKAVIGRKDLQSFITEHSPDILCINETKLSEENILKLKLRSHIPSEYQLIWNCCKRKKGYSGSAVFTKVKPLSVAYDLGIPKHDTEGRTITCEFEKFFLVTSYVPNAGVGKLERLDYRVNEWDTDFQDYLQGLEKSGKPIILCGDLNVGHLDIDVHNPKGLKKCAGFTPQERESFGNFLDKGFIDTFRHLHEEEQKFSFWSAKKQARASNKGWRLDYFVTSKNLIDNIDDSEIHDQVMGSDHCPISVTLNLKKGIETGDDFLMKSGNKE